MENDHWLTLCRDLAAQRTSEVDLSHVENSRSNPADPTQSLLLALVLLSMPDAPELALHINESESALGFLARSGVLLAAGRRNAQIIGAPITSHQRLRNEAWSSWDEYLSGGEGALHVLPDLELASHRPQPMTEDGRYFPWLTRLRLGSKLSSADHRQLITDVDSTLFELTDNVHRWSRSSRAVASVGVTRGGGVESHDRCHIVVIDDGIGVLKSLADDPPALLEVKRQTEGPEGCMSLVAALLTQKFAERGQLPGHHGHGLYTACKHAAVSRVGTLEILTGTGNGIIHVTAKSGAPIHQHFIKLPGIFGTAVRASFNAVPAADSVNELDSEQLALV